MNEDINAVRRDPECKISFNPDNYNSTKDFWREFKRVARECDASDLGQSSVDNYEFYSTMFRQIAAIISTDNALCQEDSLADSFSRVFS